MNEFNKILYLTIAEYELHERARRNDFTFSAWKHIAHLIGHKSESTLRKMCEQRSESNAAKLGLEEAFIIMNETRDYRLFVYLRERLKEAKRNHQQLNMFAEPIRSLEDLQ